MTDTATLVLLKTGDVLCLYDGMSWRLPCVQDDSMSEMPFADILPGSRLGSVLQTATNPRERQRGIFVKSLRAKARWVTSPFFPAPVTSICIIRRTQRRTEMGA